jgi:hypothetical protein
MTSAFGIDHGEFSKARQQQRPTSPFVTATHGKLKRIGAAAGKATSAQISLAEVGRQSGRAVKGAGELGSKILTAKPGLTGAVLVGGTGAGLYAAGRPKKKKPVSKLYLS